jgi:hypothetical protein
MHGLLDPPLDHLIEIMANIPTIRSGHFRPVAPMPGVWSWQQGSASSYTKWWLFVYMPTGWRTEISVAPVDGNLAATFTGGRESRELAYVQNGFIVSQSCRGVGSSVASSQPRTPCLEGVIMSKRTIAVAGLAATLALAGGAPTPPPASRGTPLRRRQGIRRRWRQFRGLGTAERRGLRAEERHCGQYR